MRSDAAELAETLTCGLTGADLRNALNELHGSTLRPDWVDAAVVAVGWFERDRIGREADQLATLADNAALKCEIAERDAVIKALRNELAALNERADAL